VYLVISQVTSLVLITSSSPLSLPGILGILTGGLSLLVTAYVVTERRRQLFVAAVLCAFALLPSTWFSTHPGSLSPRLADATYVLILVFWLLFTLYVTLMVFRGIMAARTIRANEIYGAIYVYILIGILFAQAYQLLLARQPDALYFDPQRFPATGPIGRGLYTHGAGDLAYYSFVTLCTVGYGDVTPASPVARSLSLIEAVIGILYVATMIARFVSIQTGGAQGRAHDESV